jgi:hypothetical protein
LKVVRPTLQHRRVDVRRPEDGNLPKTELSCPPE